MFCVTGKVYIYGTQAHLYISLILYIRDSVVFFFPLVYIYISQMKQFSKFEVNQFSKLARYCSKTA